jgi:signal transduction histidine kinase
MLIVARRVRTNGQTHVQGFWLDWDALRKRLTEEAHAELPGVSLSPLRATDAAEPNRLLAILPVQIELPPMQVGARSESPLRWALVAAWVGLLAAGIAAGITLSKVIALSERRAAFVSAVTHELRTPLTTFRLYADMLAGGVVAEESRKQQYLDTLRREADRLAHLVDNVLQYARLERGRPGGRREALSLGELLDRMVPRFVDRAKQAEMDLEVQVAPELRDGTLTTDPQAVEQILFNLVDNSAKYAAHATERRIVLSVERLPTLWRFSVSDYGPGVPQSVRRRLFQPFCKPVEEAARTAPGVGLGLALSRRLAADLDGRLTLCDQPGGARFVLELP